MRSIIIVIHALGCGGAEKSLISFLNYLNTDEWNVDLLIMSPGGILEKEIPRGINVIQGEYDVENLMTSFSDRRKKIAGFGDLIRQIRWNIHKKDVCSSGLKYDEYKWKYWGKYLPCRKKKYELAISYMHGIPNYYVIDKVNSEKKILWIHNDYQKLGLNQEFEKEYFRKADRVVTISESCLESYVSVFPEFESKICVLENISSEDTIRKLSKEKINDLDWANNAIKILSIGRLNAQKGFDMAINAAKVLKENKYDFVWYILGEGPLRAELEKQIVDLGLQDIVRLPGIKANPYPYIDSCTVFVQPSLFEGKSIVLDEAKILCKPILVTNYDTVGSSIINDINGKIVDINPDSIAIGLQNMLDDTDYCTNLVHELQREQNSNEHEIEKYITLMQNTIGLQQS